MLPPETQGPGSPADWLRHARSDLALAQVSRPVETLLVALCFHAQQAAEKAIKAVLLQEESKASGPYNIRALLEQLPDDIDFPSDVANAAELTEFAVEARYSGAIEEVSDTEYSRAVSLAMAVVRWAETQIKG